MNRLMKLPLLAGVVGALLLTAPGADAGGKSKMKSMFKMMPKPVVVAPRPVVVAPRPVVVVPMPPVVPHVHTNQVLKERVWVPPVYEDQVVGYDFFGQPVVRRVKTESGHFKLVSVHVCACGDRL